MKSKCCISFCWLCNLIISASHLQAQPENNALAAVTGGTYHRLAHVDISGNANSTTPAEFGVFYAITDRQGNPPACLITIDPVTGAGTLVGSTRLIDGLSGLAINSKGEMYGTDYLSGDLYSIDAATGETHFVVNTGWSSLEAIAFDRNDSLYGISNYDRALYVIDPASGSRRLIGPLEDMFVELAFDPTDGTLWGSKASGGIFSIDPTTAVTSLVGFKGFLGETFAIECDHLGNLYGIAVRGQYTEGSVIALDKTTGAGRRIGETGFKVITGLAARHGILEGPQISIFHTKVSFGRVLVGTVSPLRAVTLRSVGNDTLIVTSITVPGMPFLVSDLQALPLILPPGSSTTFEVAFTPSNAGDFATTLSITSNDANDPIRSIVLNGQAKDPAPPGSALFASDMGSSTIKRLDPITFSVLDTIPAPEPVSIYSGDIAYDGSSLFFHGSSFFSGTSIIYELDPATGQVRQTIPVPACGSRSEIAHSGSSLFGVCQDYSIFELDPITGLVVNNFSPDATVAGCLTFGGSRGTLFAYVNYSRISELNASTGAEINSFSIQDDFVYSLAYSDRLGVLFASSSNGNIYMLNPDNGSIIDSWWARVPFAALCADEYTVPIGANLALGPREINFGRHVLGKKSTPRNLLLRSIGTDTLTVFSLVPPGAPFELVSLPSFPLVISPISRVETKVTFSPTSMGPVEAVVTVSSDDVNKPLQSTTIRGEGVAPPAPGTLFGSDAEYLFILDPTSAARQFIGAIKGMGSIAEIEFRSDGTLFGTTSGQSSKLIAINVPDGTPDVIAECRVGDGCTISALEFDAADRLYGVVSYYPPTFTPAQLVIIDTGSGDITLIGSIGHFDGVIGGLTFGPDSTLYSVYSGPDNESHLITIDRFTGVNRVVGGIGFEDVSSMEFGPDGVLYGGTAYGSLITIDPQTGKGKFVGRSSFAALNGLAFYPDIKVGIGTIEGEQQFVDLPSDFALTFNYPNPFNPTTQLRYQLPETATVIMTIFNTLGQKVQSLVKGEAKVAGYHEVEWNGRNEGGDVVPSGTYFCYFKAYSKDRVYEKKLKMTLMR